MKSKLPADFTVPACLFYALGPLASEMDGEPMIDFPVWVKVDVIGELHSGSWPFRSRSTSGIAVGKLTSFSPMETKPMLSAAKPSLRAAQRTLSEVICVSDTRERAYDQTLD